MGTRTAWERFQRGDDQGDGDTELDVRREVLTSWRRSHLSGVDPSRLDVPHEEIDPDSRFARAVRPVLDAGIERMAGTGMCLAVTDRAGRVLWSWGPDPLRRRRLDQLGLLEGFRFDEETAGTNGLGTALETGQVVAICGAEHYKEVFHGAACVAAPVHHPVTGRVAGAVDITCRPEEVHPLLRTAVLAMVCEIQGELVAASTERERRLFELFLAEPMRRTAPVVALDRDVLIANEAAAGLRIDHHLLWERVRGAADGEIIALPGGDHCTARVRLVAGHRRGSGAVLVLDAAPAGPAPGPIRPAHLPAHLQADRRLTLLERAEAGVIAQVLTETAGNKTEAARRLGITRPTLYARMRAYRL